MHTKIQTHLSPNLILCGWILPNNQLQIFLTKEERLEQRGGRTAVRSQQIAVTPQELDNFRNFLSVLDYFYHYHFNVYRPAASSQLGGQLWQSPAPAYSPAPNSKPQQVLNLCSRHGQATSSPVTPATQPRGSSQQQQQQYPVSIIQRGRTPLRSTVQNNVERRSPSSMSNNTDSSQTTTGSRITLV